MKEFQKYIKNGAYHWRQISKNPFKRYAFVLGRYQNIVDLVTKNIDIKDKLILDVGCGDGVLTNMLKNKGGVLYGVDSSDVAIKFAKQYCKNIYFKQGCVYNLPYNDNFFDIIVSTEVIEHLKDVERFLSEIKRVSKNGSIVIITTPIRFTEYPRDKEHIVEWYPDQFKSIIEKKFKNTKYYYSHPIALEQLYHYTIFDRNVLKVLFNIISLIKNPFRGFNSKFKYKMIQYSISIVDK